ncbi:MULTISPECIES: DnaD domain protein [unclassified Sporosarcina]|uniref:DnaD domain protein n=1 Tax=unclassified Sporosarcina TaxID=2647733 RepID=UPI0020403547|nr:MULTISPECIES: DnaD domain protein [unclassified Sporosarcina]GKV65552.1 hypothetical protein NCCP2331_17050 [Sporosarcina sp. NCCP-2331]GLB55677.1 hypothetical protein NCCP2378_14640 [Sporosarcina sp. NCCP-2378]
MDNDDKDKDSRMEELLNYLENTTTEDMLRDMSGGKKPFAVDVQLAERLVNKHGMSTGVVNVLFQYVFLRNEGKFTTNYIERIASHWMHKKVTTAREALEVSRNEHRKYEEWKRDGQQSKKEAGNTKVIEARQIAIEIAVRDASMSDEQLGKFVREMFTTK